MSWTRPERTLPPICGWKLKFLTQLSLRLNWKTTCCWGVFVYSWSCCCPSWQMWLCSHVEHYHINIGYICRLQVAFISTQRLDDRKLEHLFLQCYHSASFKPLGNLNSNPQGFYSAWKRKPLPLPSSICAAVISLFIPTNPTQMLTLNHNKRHAE